MSRLLTIAAFGVALGLFAVVEVLGRREHSKVPTIGDVCAVVMHYRVGRLPVGRLAMFGFWWWLGWHFFAR
jgi:Family of unknown function (DUF6186)